MKPRHIKLEYDSEVDAAYLTLARGRVIESEELLPGVVVDLDADDQILGIEILRFTRRFRPQKASGTSATAPRKRPTTKKPIRSSNS
jgi:uncharacterized protein YuzE